MSKPVSETVQIHCLLTVVKGYKEQGRYTQCADL